MEQLFKRVRTGKKFNEYMNFGNVEAYVRRTRRWNPIARTNISTMEIGNISAHPQKNGHGTAFLNEFEQAARLLGLAVFVECVHSDVLMRILLKRGYTQEPTDDEGSDHMGANWWLLPPHLSLSD